MFVNKFKVYNSNKAQVSLKVFINYGATEITLFLDDYDTSLSTQTLSIFPTSLKIKHIKEKTESKTKIDISLFNKDKNLNFCYVKYLTKHNPWGSFYKIQLPLDESKVFLYDFISESNNKKLKIKEVDEIKKKDSIFNGTMGEMQTWVSFENKTEYPLKNANVWLLRDLKDTFSNGRKKKRKIVQYESEGRRSYKRAFSKNSNVDNEESMQMEMNRNKLNNSEGDVLMLENINLSVNEKCLTKVQNKELNIKIVNLIYGSSGDFRDYAEKSFMIKGDPNINGPVIFTDKNGEFLTKKNVNYGFEPFFFFPFKKNRKVIYNLDCDYKTDKIQSKIKNEKNVYSKSDLISITTTTVLLKETTYKFLHVGEAFEGIIYQARERGYEKILMKSNKDIIMNGEDLIMNKSINPFSMYISIKIKKFEYEKKKDSMNVPFVKIFERKSVKNEYTFRIEDTHQLDDLFRKKVISKAKYKKLTKNL